jgi:exosortase
MATIAKSVPEEHTHAAGAPFPWKSMAWFGALLFLCYAPVLYRLAQNWYNDEDMGHGFFVPIVAAYIVWRRRHALAALKPETNYWGLLVVLWGALQFMLGTLGAELFLSRTAFLISLIGVVWFLCGTKILKLVAFPLILLWFMIPIPAIIYARITLPLQLFASRVAETFLGLIDIPVLRDGNVLELASQKLSVVEACSGIRSLLALTFLGLIYAYFFDRKVWMRWALLIATVPIAIAANAARVTITGILWQYRPEWAQGAFHLLEGWVLFLVAFALMVVTHGLLNRIYKTVRHPAEGKHA